MQSELVPLQTAASKEMQELRRRLAAAEGDAGRQAVELDQAGRRLEELAAKAQASGWVLSWTAIVRTTYLLPAERAGWSLVK